MTALSNKAQMIFLTAAATLIVAIILLEYSILRHTGGAISYPADAAFLDISVAKNLAFNKVWGISRHAFQSASSSLLYPILLAFIFFITGSHLVIPIILNTVLAILFLRSLQQALIRRNFNPSVQLTVLLAVSLLGLLPLLVISGTRLPLQLLVCFLFFETVVNAIQRGSVPLPRKVYLYGLLATTAGYEDVILLVLICILLVAMHRRKQALRLAAISLSPTILFGVISLLKGGYFLPNSLILAPYPGYLVFLTLASLAAGLLMIKQFHKLTSTGKPVSLYLLSLSLMGILAIPFAFHNFVTLWHFKQDSISIYEQQFPMAGFVHRYYDRTPIGLNDIGAVAYFSSSRKVDLSGLASNMVTKSKKDNTWGPDLADSLTRKEGSSTAIISDPALDLEHFPRWNLDPNNPLHWTKLASWKLPDTQFSDGKTFTFYSMWDSTRLLKNLHEYEQRLPAGAAVQYY